MKIKHKIYFLFYTLLSFSCQNESKQANQIRISTEDFAEETQVSPTLAKGLSLELWAPGPLLSNAVALSFDHHGVAYVSETVRRKSSDIDIREHPDWMTEDLALQSLEDTRDFHLKKLATEHSAENTWQEDFNKDGFHDYRDLEVQSEQIRRIWDSDGDGRADVSQLYAQGFNDMLTGVAAGILSYDDAVFLSAAPDLWRLKDKNGDGLADQRTKISHGYGIHIGYAGHDMSGLTMGMDGKIYWSIGDLGVNAIGTDGRRWAYPHQGAVMRCNPDGSDFEVFARGLRNPQELAFDSYGNLFSVDNDGDHRGEHERYVHIIQGSDSGWRTYWQFGKYNDSRERYKVWMDEKLYLPHFPGQATYLLPPIALAYNGPAGLAFNPGTALSPRWKDHFFASYFTGSSSNSKIQAFQVRPKGASFSVDSIQDIVGGIVPTGITFGPDGHLYINDWKDSYDKKPQGRIWKLKVSDPVNQVLQNETQLILAQGMQQRQPQELAQLLDHPDQRVRMAAQFALVKRKKVELLLNHAQSSSTLLGRLHAIWGMGQLGRQKPALLQNLLPLLNDPTPEVRAQTAKVLGEAPFPNASEPLLTLLQDNNASVQYFAANALGKIGQPAAIQPLVTLLAATKEQDPHLRHGLIYALSQLATDQDLGDLASHPSVFVRLGAVVALREQQSAQLALFLTDNDPLVLAEAARAINDDNSIPAAIPALANALTRVDIKNEAFLRRAINANLRLADAESAQRLATFARKNSVDQALRIDAIWALGYWAKPPVLDRVDGRYRNLSGHRLEDAQSVFIDLFELVLQEDKEALSSALAQSAAALRIQDVSPTLYAILADKTKTIDLRKSALQALATLQAPELSQALNLALDDSKEEIRLLAQAVLNQSDLPNTTMVRLLDKILKNNSIPEKQQALASLARIGGAESQQLLASFWKTFQEAQLDSALHLDLLMAIDSSSFMDLKQEKKAMESKPNAKNSLSRYASTLYGGDIERGKQIFNQNEAAQCQRCHATNSTGAQVGPPLAGIGKLLSRKDLLLALVEPNDRIAPGYGTVILSLKDGQESAGILLEETKESIKIQIRQDSVIQVSKKDIQKQETLASGMLNMGEVLDKKQIRDLVAFLVQL